MTTDAFGWEYGNLPALAAGSDEHEIDRRSRVYIAWAQESLNRILGTGLAVDGLTGRKTRGAIRKFQIRAHLTPDGVLGPMTEAALIRAGAAAPPQGGGSSAGAAPAAVDTSAGTGTLLVGGRGITPPAGLSVTNFLDPGVPKLRARNRRGRVIDEFVVHETVTRSASATVSVLQNRGLGVHFIMGPDGTMTQHGDLADDLMSHAAPHNTRSVGIEVVNPYYPGNLRSGLAWSRTIRAGWADKGEYVLPTPAQAEATARLTAWITSARLGTLQVPRTWIGASGGSLSMSRVPDGDRARPGIYAHTYFHHADGSWLALYAWLRLMAGMSASAAYEEAARLAATPSHTVPLPRSSGGEELAADGSGFSGGL